MDDKNPNSPKMMRIKKARMDLSKCLISKDTWSGVGDCLSPFSDDEEEDVLKPVEEKQPEQEKEEPKRKSPSRSYPRGGSALG